MRENSKVKIPVKLRFEYSPERGKFVYRPYVALGSGTEKIERGADFGPVSGEYHKWYFNIRGKIYPILFEGMPITNERDHHVMLDKSALRYFDDILSLRAYLPEKPWVIRLP